MPEQNIETRPNLSGKYGILTRIRLGRATLALAAIEVPASVATVATDSPWPIAAGAVAGLWVAGETVYDFYQNRNRPTHNLDHRLSQWLAKDDTEK